VNAKLPANANLLPPGSYLLSGVDINGVPTPAQLVTIKRSGAGTVTRYDKDRTAADKTGPNTRVRFPFSDGYLKAGAEIRVDASDPSGVTEAELLINGKLADTEQAGQGGAALRWSPTAPNGPATMTVRVHDSLGNTTETTRRVVVDNDRPTITVTPGTYVRGTTVTAGVTTARDASGLANLRVQIDGGPSATATAAPWTVRLTSRTWSSKRHTITFQARDKAGNTTVLQRPLYIDNQKPSVGFKSAPKNNTKLRKTVTISATATDSLGVNRVQLLVNGEVAATDKKAGYSFKLNPKKYGKKFTVRLRAYDHAGNVVTSGKRTYRR
jgi:hypothetical protein